ncbi:MAG: TIGR00341 family protein [Balneolaceae bacterium]
MAQRLMEVVFSSKNKEKLDDLLEDKKILGYWTQDLAENRMVARILVSVEATEQISDHLAERFMADDAFRMMLFSVEATVPKPEEEESQPEEEAAEQAEDEAPVHSMRISRDELYSDVNEHARLGPVYLSTVVLSVIVAAIGLLKGDVAVVIGAMVIAPLLGPNVALSLAVTLGDLDLGRRALKVNVLGLLIALGVSFAIGWIFGVNPEIDQIANRTVVNFGDVILALAAGSAGVLAFTRGVPAGVIGVMVAVALLPPLVVSGLLAGAGYWGLATGAILLTITNVCGLNLSGVMTFLVQGVRPRHWWEAKQAKQASRNAIIFWLILLAVFTAIIFLR